MTTLLDLNTLLDADPEAARRTDSLGQTLAHSFCSDSRDIRAHECVQILKLLMIAHPDAFTEFATGMLPIHNLALRGGGAEALEFLLDAHPETATKLMTHFHTKSYNLLHGVAEFRGYDDYDRYAEPTVAKARLLCARYPSMMLQRNGEGYTPLFLACYLLLAVGSGSAPYGHH